MVQSNLIETFFMLNKWFAWHILLSRGHVYYSIHEFAIIKYFNIKCHPSTAPRIIQFNWCFSSHNWFKYTTNGASIGTYGISTSGDIFIDNLGTMLGVFSDKIGVCTSFQAQLHKIMLVVEYANKRNWRNFWLEINLLLVIRVFSIVSTFR